MTKATNYDGAIHNEAKEAIQQALAAKLVQGVTATTFAPQSDATRAEAGHAPHSCLAKRQLHQAIDRRYGIAGLRNVPQAGRSGFASSGPFAFFYVFTGFIWGAVCRFLSKFFRFRQISLKPNARFCCIVL